MSNKSSGNLVIEHVVKSFQQRGGPGLLNAVDDVSLTIQQGEFVTLLGPSGCGKTTTLRLIAGFEVPTAGRILLDGNEITHQPPNKRDMAMVFQSYALFPHMSVHDNVAYGLQTRRLSGSEINLKVQQALDMIDLGGLGNRRPNQLSGGQQQRVALARALVMEPRVLLFDEPLSNLDAKLRVQMRSEIRTLQRRLNITSVYVTHDQIEAMSMSDRIVVMNAGRIDQIGTPNEIYRHPATRFVADFIGVANFVETRAESVADGQVTVTLLGQTVKLPMNPSPQSGEAVVAVLRPEGMQLSAESGGCMGKVEQAMYLGSSVEYVISVEGQRMTAMDSDPRSSRIFTEGQAVGVGFVAEAVHLLRAGK